VSPLSARRAARLLKAARALPVLVVGDVMLDEFVWGKVSRVSPEAPVPVVQMDHQTFHLGGAANVAHNVKSLGGAPVLVGAVGEDDPRRRFVEVLEAAGVGTSGILTVPSRSTTVKTRIVAHHQQVVRVDRESRDEIPKEAEDALLAAVDRALSAAPILVISDYDKGLLTARVLTAIIKRARRRRVPVLVDPKLKRFAHYRGATIVTPNAGEAEQASGVPLSGVPSLVKAADHISRALACRAVLITRGEEGMSLFEHGKPHRHIHAAAREVFDVTGAGDTVIATLALAVAAGATLYEAADLANRAAGIVVGKLGTATVAPEELLASFG